MTASWLLAAISTAILLQVAFGICIAFWRLKREKSVALPSIPDDVFAPATGAWSGWREFRVAGSTFEDSAKTQRSLILAPVDELPLTDFEAGQYLTFSFELTAPSRQTIVRCYSLSDLPNTKTYQITVKRMPAPIDQPEIPQGAAST